MQIHGFTSPQTLQFTFSSESQRNALLGRLTQGQTLEAAVLKELSDGRFAIRFFGHTLVAESHLALSPGARVQARVESLGPPLVLTLTGKTGSEETSLRDALRSLALPDDDLNRSIVRGLIARGHTVDRNQAQALRDLLGGLQGTLDLDNAEALEAVITRALFLQDQGLPVTPDTLAAYLTHLPPGILGGLLESLTDLLRSLHSPALPQADRLADRIRQATPELGSLTPETLRTLLTTLGPDLEGRLVAWSPGRLAGRRQNRPSRRTGRHPQTRPAQTPEPARSPRFRYLPERSSLPGSGNPATLRHPPGRQPAHPHTRSASLPKPLLYWRGANHSRPSNLLPTKRGQTGDRSRKSPPDPCPPPERPWPRPSGPVYCAPTRFVPGICRHRKKVTFLQGASNELKAGLEKCGYTVAEVACRIT